MASDFVQRVKTEVGIDTYISRFVKLNRAGKRYVGLCPFHKEKSPSFTVSPELQLYHCFGCNASGDIFKFVMDFERVDFVRSMEILSDYSGIPIQKEASSRDQAEKEEMFVLNKKFLNFFKENLKSSETNASAQNYLNSRKLSAQVIDAFQIGFAPAGFNSWLKLNLSQRETDIALKLGLLKKSDSGKIYDFFRERIIFPILDTSLRVVGFGGRIIQNSEEAKYINSPTSPVYDKGKLFFNLNNSQEMIRKTREAILVEGYLDVMGLYAKDIKNVVAPLGTALTENQIRYLKSFADKALIIFDGDSAGRKAAFRASELCTRENLLSNVILLENGIDPFDLSIQKTQHEIYETFSKSIPASIFIVNESTFGVDSASRPELKRNALVKLFEYIKSLKNETDKDAFLREGAKKLGLSIESVLSDFHKGVKSNFKDLNSDNNTSREKVTKTNLEPIVKCERKIVTLLMLHEELKFYLNQIYELNFIDGSSSLLRDWLYNRMVSEESFTYNDLLEAGLDKQILDDITPYLFQEEYSKNNSMEDKELMLKSCLLQREKFNLEEEKRNLETRNMLDNFQEIKEIRAKLEKVENEIKLLNY
jgi:DNA primase